MLQSREIIMRKVMKKLCKKSHEKCSQVAITYNLGMAITYCFSTPLAFCLNLFDIVFLFFMFFAQAGMTALSRTEACKLKAIMVWLIIGGANISPKNN